MKSNIIQDKSYSFALKIILLSRDLQADSKEYIISNQLLKSGTSIGANIEEALGGQSRKDFYAKLTISYKEARETKFWLKLLRDSSFVDPVRCNSLLSDTEEILRILGSIKRTLQKERKE